MAPSAAAGAMRTVPLDPALTALSAPFCHAPPRIVIFRSRSRLWLTSAFHSVLSGVKLSLSV